MVTLTFSTSDRHAHLHLSALTLSLLPTRYTFQFYPPPPLNAPLTSTLLNLLPVSLSLMYIPPLRFRMDATSTKARVSQTASAFLTRLPWAAAGTGATVHRTTIPTLRCRHRSLSMQPCLQRPPLIASASSTRLAKRQSTKPRRQAPPAIESASVSLRVRWMSTLYSSRQPQATVSVLQRHSATQVSNLRRCLPPPVLIVSVRHARHVHRATPR